MDGNVARLGKRKAGDRLDEQGIRFGCLTPGEAHRLREIDKWVLTSF